MPIVETITTAFSSPGAHVVLVDVDTTSRTSATSETSGANTTTGKGPVRVARDAVRALDRTVATLSVDVPAGASVALSRPFWADLVTDPATPVVPVAESPSRSACTATADRSDRPTVPADERADLLIVALPAHAAETVPLDQVALLAADQLRNGGVLAVHTHSDWTQGRLVDPTGAIVAACQHADLLYLQHIVALHTPVRDGHLHAAPPSAAAEEYDRTRHGAAARGLPTPHLRAHADILVFAQPADPGALRPETGAPTAVWGPESISGGGR